MNVRTFPLALPFLVLAAAVLPASLAGGAGGPQSAVGRDYVRATEAWRTQRETELKADDGWLTLVGLHWLREGINRVGSDPGAEVPLPPHSAPAEVGTITFHEGAARFAPASGAMALINGRPAGAQLLRPQPGDYDVVAVGSVRFFVIKRGDRYGVRVRDGNSPSRRDFGGVHWYPVREAYRITARFIPHATPTSITIANVLGALEPWPTPGKVVFTLGGRQCTLHPVLDGPDAKELFFIFRDRTTGTTTYPGGRFLYAAMPSNGEVVLDFNRAISPPCAFTAYATCPLPPSENTLPVKIEAGELDPHR